MLPNKIAVLRKALRLSQSELGRRLGASAMAVSRWERGQGRPTGTMLLKLGILAEKDPRLCWIFWNIAGLSAQDVMRVLPIAEKRFRRKVPVLKIVHAGSKPPPIKHDLVAIPFLQVFAAAGKEPGSSEHDLSHARFDQVIAAPKLWCPNPTRTVCMRVKGNSMEPALFDGYIIVVDQAQTDKKSLHGKIIVAQHEKFGLVVSRYWHLKDTQALVSDNRRHDPVPLTAAWRVVGKVLWWIGEASE